MRHQFLAVVSFLSILHIPNVSSYAETPLPELLTPEQAEAIVKQRRENKEATEQAAIEAALGKEAVEERVLRREDGQQIVFRRVALAEKIELTVEPDQATTLPLPGFISETEAEEQLHETIHLGADVYGDQYSEIQWRDPEAQLQMTVWTNINLGLLRPVTAFSVDDVQYSYLGFVTHYSEEAEQVRIAMTQEQGVEFTSSWKTPPVVFSNEYYEYFVDAPWDAEIPEKLYRQLDALFSFYLSSYDRLEIEYKNTQMLQAAREKDSEENPPVKPTQIIMNYTPLRGEAAE